MVYPPKYLCMSINHLMDNGFITLRCISTSSSTLSSSCLQIISPYQFWNCLLMKSFAGLFTLRSKGCSWFVRFARTNVYKILLSPNNLHTSSVHWPLNTSNMTRAGWLLLSPSCFLFSYIWNYDTTNEIQHGGGDWPMIGRMCNIPSFWKFNPLWQASCSSPFVY